MSSPTPKPLFSQPKDFACKVWRYLDLAKAISLLQSEELFFCRADLFQDTHEGTITKPIADAWARIASRANAPQLEEVMSLARKCARKTVFINCWHLNESESEAMWQLYCPNNQGVALQTTYAKLAKWSLTIPNSFIGMVSYLDYEMEKFPTDNFLKAFMHKRRSFAHENEVRIMISEHEELRKHDAKSFEDLLRIEQQLSGQHTGKRARFSLEENVEVFWVNPYAPSWYFKVVKNLIATFKPPLVNRVRKSPLKDAPYF